MNQVNKTCAFYSLGCKVNQYETQLIRESFLKQGFAETENIPMLCIVNACTLTSSADRKARQLIKSLHRKNPGARIIVTGCLAQEPEKLGNLNDIVTHIVPQDKKYQIARIISQYKKDQPDSARKVLKEKNKFTQMRIKSFAGHCRAFVKVQDGCDNCCTYCIIPSVRGNPVSKYAKNILLEIRQLTRSGVKEIVLTGINLGAWGKDLKTSNSLSSLVEDILNIRSLKRLRLSSIELQDVDTKLLKLMVSSEKFCAHLHIPLQSGDDTVLKAMNRKYSSKEYLDKIRYVKKLVRGVSLTTDVIVGFPQEGEKEFVNTLKMVRRAGFSRVHIFTYSQRHGTLAAVMRGQVDEKIKEQRRFRLKEAAGKADFIFRKRLLKKTIPVLFEKKHGRFWGGYTDSYIYVFTEFNENIENMIIPVTVTCVTADKTMGKINLLP
ncbi:MAG: tRNA (N(6)-L-threonylcarbamoyladenosine(37)-C(2))-methylthiotransferase MtaB [Candidatus Omnitrophica bacterium]|nr:tRNA (N(6)-L-threonylcarbamoyladenosine(37)-C(2))-methylthiotransferase MtaB [Candidatus Omnitrophota bacterium]